MNIPKFSIKRPVTIFMGILVVLMFGVVSYSKLNLDLLPAIDLPMLMISTGQEAAGPEEIESAITNPMESVLATVSNVKNIRSVSSEGNSMIMVEFEEGTDMDFASLEVREKIDLIKNLLPSDIRSPLIMKMNPSMLPIMNFGVSYEGYDLSQLSTWANTTLKPILEKIDGVAQVDIQGGVEDQIQIVVDPNKLATYSINMNSIIMSIKSQQQNLPIGSINEGNYQLLVRTYNPIYSIEDIKNITVNAQNGEVLKVGDLAKVELAKDRGNSYSKINGEEALILSVQKESTANTVEVTKKIHSEIDKLKGKNKQFNAIKVLDQGEFIEFAVDSVKTNAIIGALLAIIILLLFLKDIRTTLIMAISIPISLISTFVLIYFGGLTLNMISLGGMAIGVGMLVDNSIVVIENIYRHKKMGLSNIEAAIKGTSQVALAISASTLTTICVFLPIVFVEGMAADIFKEMALTVTFSLLSSLMVAFTIVPLLSAKLINEKSLKKDNKLVSKLVLKYKNLLRWSLNSKKTVIGILLVTISIGAISLYGSSTEFFPTVEQGVVSVSIKAPKGSNELSTKEVTDETILKLKGVTEVQTIAVMGNKDNTTIHLMLKSNKGISDKEVANKVRNKVKDIAGAKIEVTAASMGMSTGAPVQLNISGDNLETLDKLSKELVTKMSKIQGVTDVKASNEKSADELRIRIDKDKAASYGLTPIQVAQSAQAIFTGMDIGNVTLDNTKYTLRISAEESANPTVSSLNNIIIYSPKGAKIPLKDVAIVERGRGYTEIQRNNQSRVVTISSNLEGISLGDAVNRIDKVVSKIDLPDGYKIQHTGEAEQMKDAFKQLMLALLLAIALVYMVMAAQFESLINPLVIMFTVPIAFVGAIVLLFLTKTAISMPTMIGLVMLTGIIVNNGIVLVDFINQYRKEGYSTREAIMESSPTRLQPILMTTLTTVFGLIPMAVGIGKGTEIQIPLALSVIGGLTFGTILTLFIVPVIYEGIDIIKVKIRNLRNKDTNNTESIINKEF